VDSGGDAAGHRGGEYSATNKMLNTFYDGFGGGWRWRGFGGFGGLNYHRRYVIRSAPLVVDLFDASTKKLIWRGSASDTLSDKSDKNIKTLDKGVQKMFDHFPPTPKK